MCSGQRRESLIGNGHEVFGILMASKLPDLKLVSEMMLIASWA